MSSAHRLRLLLVVGLIAMATSRTSGQTSDASPFVRAFWLIQSRGTIDAADPRNDQKTKGRLAKALGKDGVLSVSGVKELMDNSTFEKLAGSDLRLDPVEAEKALADAVPESRKRLNPKIAAHAELLTTSFDLIDEPHRQASEQFSDWILKNYKAGTPLHVTVICTGNSRRSILGSTMGNIAAAFYGMPEIRYHSGGTAPTAFNPRTIAALEAIGVAVEPTGAEAPRGEPKTPNPVYKVRWGTSGDPALEATEFSKTYFDGSNPQSGFAALMVCGEADASCPLVKGASARISAPYLDPKIYDGSAYEAVKYAERRDDIGRLMLSAMMRVRNQLNRP